MVDFIHCDSSGGITTSERPRVGILNRRGSVGRSVSNADHLIQILSDTVTKNGSASVSPIEYFEQKTFLEQVQFFGSIDILISPHGAQLTGIPFLANKPCTQLLELFPKAYALPNFFGSLARNSGVGYSYLYLSENPPEGEQAESLQERIRARAQSLCPSPTLITTIVQELITDWHSCWCDKKQF
jgi:hypothetical protein